MSSGGELLHESWKRSRGSRSLGGERRGRGDRWVSSCSLGPPTPTFTPLPSCSWHTPSSLRAMFQDQEPPDPLGGSEPCPLGTAPGGTWLPWWLSWLRICLQCRRPGFDPWVGKTPWRREGSQLGYSGLEDPTDCHSERRGGPAPARLGRRCGDAHRFAGTWAGALQEADGGGYIGVGAEPRCRAGHWAATGTGGVLLFTLHAWPWAGTGPQVPRPGRRG